MYEANEQTLARSSRERENNLLLFYTCVPPLPIHNETAREKDEEYIRVDFQSCAVWLIEKYVAIKSWMKRSTLIHVKRTV